MRSENLRLRKIRHTFTRRCHHRFANLTRSAFPVRRYTTDIAQGGPTVTGRGDGDDERRRGFWQPSPTGRRAAGARPRQDIATLARRRTGPFAAQGTFDPVPPGGGATRGSAARLALARRSVTRVPGRGTDRLPGRLLPVRAPRLDSPARAPSRAPRADPTAARIPRVDRPAAARLIPRVDRAARHQAEYPGWTEPPGYQGGYQRLDRPPAHRGEYPSQPPYQGQYPGQPVAYGQYALHPDHPSWPESQFAPWPGDATAASPVGGGGGPPLPNRVRPPYTPQPDFPPRADAPPHTLAPLRDIPLHRDMDFYRRRSCRTPSPT